MFLTKCLIFNLIELLIKNQKNISSEFLSDIIFKNYISESEYDNFKQHKDFFDIFYFTTSSKILLKENIFFHLYISECPCGDSSIYPSNLDNNQTGSKTMDEVVKHTNGSSKIMHDNSICKVRTKSMRSDIKNLMKINYVAKLV